MAEFDAEIKEWGNSYGIIVPKEIIAQAKLKGQSKVHILLVPKNNVLARSFGKLKGWKLTGQELKDRARRALYD
jgi:antitoxin component of MazEF toxin-antitoxin module